MRGVNPATQRNQRNKMKKHNSPQGAPRIGSGALLGGWVFNGCCGVFMLLLAAVELRVGGVPDGFWWHFFWGMVVGLPLMLALFLMPPMEELRKQAAQCRKARQAIGPEGGPIGRMNRSLQQLCVLLLCLRYVVYYILKIHAADRNIVIGRDAKGVSGKIDMRHVPGIEREQSKRNHSNQPNDSEREMEAMMHKPPNEKYRLSEVIHDLPASLWRARAADCE
jgi:hypothetical protein